MGRRLHLRAADTGRQPPAARSRYFVAHHRRPVDAGPSRGAAYRRLFIYHARPPLDFDAVGGGGALCQGLCAVRLERAGGAGRRGERADLCVAGEIPEPAFEPKCHDCVRRRGAGAHRAAYIGAAACAGAAGDDDVGRRNDRRGGSARRAVILAAAAACAVGQSAWRFYLRPGAGGTDRARCGGERAMRRRGNRWRCAGRHSGSAH